MRRRSPGLRSRQAVINRVTWEKATTPLLTTVRALWICAPRYGRTGILVFRTRRESGSRSSESNPRRVVRHYSYRTASAGISPGIAKRFVGVQLSLGGGLLFFCYLSQIVQPVKAGIENKKIKTKDIVASGNFCKAKPEECTQGGFHLRKKRVVLD